MSAANRVIHDTDGNILALFQLDQESGSPRVIIARYLPTGSPDTSFGTNGRTLPVLLRDADMAVSAYTNKIVVAGYRYLNGHESLIVHQFNSSGVLDTRFGTDGAQTINSLPGRELGWSSPRLAFHTSTTFVGFEVPSGSVSNLNFQFVALNSRGRVDDEWGRRGSTEVIPTPEASMEWSSLNAMTALSDGSLVAVGSMRKRDPNDYKRQMVVVKLNPDGFVDEDFDGAANGDGIVAFDFGNESDAMMTAMAVLQNGSMVFGGYAGTLGSGPWYYAFTTIDADGNVIGAFGSNGFMVSNIASDRTSPPNTIAVDSNGSLMIPVNTASSTGFLKIQDDGSYFTDPNCSACLWNTGQLNVDSRSLLLQPDGGVLIAGVSRHTEDALIALLEPDGSLDPAMPAPPIPFFYDDWGIVAMKSSPLPDGSIITVATGQSINTSRRTILFKLTPAGAPDLSFGQGGYQFLEPLAEGMWTGLYDVIIQPDGKIVTMTSGLDNQTYQNDVIMMWRNNPDGTPDNTFGTNGRAVTAEANVNLTSIAMVRLSTGKFVVSVTRNDNGMKPWLYRFNPDGSLDPGFTDANNFPGGIQPTPGEGVGIAGALELAGNDMVYITGLTNIAGTNHNYMARLKPDGTLDPAFASGRKLWQVGQPNSIQEIRSISVGADGVVSLLGTIYNPVTSDFIVQLRSDGTENTSFNGTGHATYAPVDPNAVEFTYTQAIVSTPTGVMAVGGGFADPKYFYALGRFTTAGVLDNSFGTNGLIVSGASLNNELLDIAMVSSESFIVSGWISEGRDEGLVMRIAPTSAPPTTTVPPTTAPPVTTTTEPPIRLVVTTTQAAILRRLKMTVPRGSKVAMASRTARVCRVSGTRVIATATGRCRITVTVTAKNKKKTSRTLTITVS
jgi:uncharacterized delta-60 repeat protein